MTWMRYLLFFLIAFFMISIWYAWFIFRGISNDGLMSLYNGFFPALIDQANQLNQLGEISGRTNRQILDSVGQRSEAVLRNSQILSNAAELRADLNCTFQLEAMDIDIRSSRQSFWWKLDLSPFYLTVFQSHPAPDLSIFFEAFESYDQAEMFYAQNATSEAENLFSSYLRVIENLPSGIAWSSFDCQGFSYIVFRENLE